LGDSSTLEPGGPSRGAGFDAGFINRVYLASVGVSLVVLLCLLGRVEAKWIGGFILGDGLGLALLKSNELVTARLLQRKLALNNELETKRAVRWLTLVQLGKYPLVGAVIYAGLVPLRLPPVGIFCGYVVVQVVILLKLAGKMLSQRGERGIKAGMKATRHKGKEDSGGA
jgi:hypothetical protein